MSISKETQERVNLLFKTNPEMLEKLNKCDVEAIREIGSISQKGINPDDVIVAYESGDPNTMNYLYQQAKRLVGLQELYKDLCFEYYKKTKDNSGNIEQSNNQRSV
jgi:hypothetical protein